MVRLPTNRQIRSASPNAVGFKPEHVGNTVGFKRCDDYPPSCILFLVRKGGDRGFDVVGSHHMV